ncbi:hypothetical protein B566_EDAN016018 [Ephemera danica]|nr:hypothetical protein B566_EDAN016018 [Ephemera danica]
MCNATEILGATVVWRREDSRNIFLRSESITIEGDPLILPLIERIQAGAFICTASNSANLSVRKRFIVVVNCQNPAIPLVNSSRYVIEEGQVNEEVMVMQLTVRNVEPDDDLIYSCRSENHLGYVRSIIRLRNQTVKRLL